MVIVPVVYAPGSVIKYHTHPNFHATVVRDETFLRVRHYLNLDIASILTG